MSASSTPNPTAQDEVVQLLAELLAINTSNPTHVERPAAEWVAEKLHEVGIPADVYESSRGRASTLARIPGTDPSRPPLLVHGHLDVVPADASEWRVHPFSGEVRDGYVWGRGAVDMKGMDAMVLAVVRDWARTGRRPQRDIVLAFVADEEAGGGEGAQFLIREHRDLFADCSEAISEIGGFSVTLDGGARIYLTQTAEKGINWLRLRSSGQPGHGSLIHPDNAVTALAAAVSRVGSYEHPVLVTDAVRCMLDSLMDITGLDLDPNEPERWLPLFGSAARMIGSSVRNTTNPTRFEAGYKENVIPSKGEAIIDARFLPGSEEAMLEVVDGLLGDGIERDVVMRADAVETPYEGALVDVMAAALRAEDPVGHLVPYMTSGGTDAKSFSRLGMRCFGFSPLLLPDDLDFTALFHGIDERVPVNALKFGVRVLDRTLRRA